MRTVTHRVAQSAAVIIGLVAVAAFLAAPELRRISAQQATNIDAELTAITAEVSSISASINAISTTTPSDVRAQIIAQAATRLAAVRNRLAEVRRQDVINRAIATIAAIRGEIAALPANASQAEKNILVASASARLASTLAELRQVAAEINAVYLQRGDRNSAVSTLQAALKGDASIYPEGLVTGYYGALTEAAIRRFQARMNLAVTGSVDEFTLQRLIETFGPELAAIRNAPASTPAAAPAPVYTPKG